MEKLWVIVNGSIIRVNLPGKNVRFWNLIKKKKDLIFNGHIIKKLKLLEE